MPKLRITIGMLLTLPRLWLASNRNPNPATASRPTDQTRDPRRPDAPAIFPSSSSTTATATPVTTRIRIHQPLEIPDQRRIRLRQPRTPRTRNTTRPGSSRVPSRNSAIPRRTVSLPTPVARTTAAIPPCPNNRAWKSRTANANGEPYVVHSGLWALPVLTGCLSVSSVAVELGKRRLNDEQLLLSPL